MRTSVAARRRNRPWQARIVCPIAALTLAWVLLPGITRANPPVFSGPHWRPIAWGFEGSGGWNSYQMSAVNDTLRSLNQSVGTAFNKIRHGGDFGAALRCWVDPRVLLRLHLERHLASASKGGYQYDLGTWNVGIGGTYFLPSAGGPRLGAGLAAGVTTIFGRFAGPSFAFNSRGTGPDLRATVEAMWPLGAGLSVTGTAGARFARVSDVTLAKQSSNTAANYSGFLLRVSLARDSRSPE